MAKTEVLFTRVSIDFAARVKAHAAERGFDTTAEYIRRLIEADLDGATLAARVDALEAKLSRYAEMAEQYDNLAALLADPRWQPRA